MQWQVKMAVLIALVTLPFYINVGLQFTSALYKRFSIKKSRARLFALALLVWFYIYPVYLNIRGLDNIKQHFVYNPSMGVWDYLLVYPFWWSMVTVIEITLFYLVLNLFSLVVRLFLASFREKWKKTVSTIKIFALIIIFIYTGVIMYLNTETVQISSYKVSLENIPQGLAGLKIGFIGDIHINRYTRGEKLNRVREKIKSLDSDMLLFAGDICSYGDRFVKPAKKFMEEIKSGPINISCMGDHDYWVFGWSFADFIKNRKWTFIHDSHQVINYKRYKILITGITNIYSVRPNRKNLVNLFSKIPPADLKILLVHQPSEFLVDLAEKYGYHLFLGGHTHGGQIVFHLLGFPLNQARLETPYYRGLSGKNELKVIITNGVGLTLSPVRYHAPAEITQIILQKSL